MSLTPQRAAWYYAAMMTFVPFPFCWAFKSQPMDVGVGYGRVRVVPAWKRK